MQKLKKELNQRGAQPAPEKRRLGVHTSIAGGVHLSVERAKELGCNTMQIFSHNPRQWAVSSIPRETTEAFINLRKDYDIQPVFAHSSYLINLAADDTEILAKSIQLLKRELDLADALDVEYVVVHTGSASGQTPDIGRKTAIEALQRIAGEGEWGTCLLLENTAGERGDITSKIADLAEIIDAVDSSLIAGITFDTCHAFAAGYDIRTEEGLFEVISEIDGRIGLDKVKQIHLNDALKGFASGVDRHWHIGQGQIGVDGIRNVINHPAFAEVPLILETPKKTEEDDPANLRIVRSLLEK